MEKNLTHQRLLDMLNYDPTSGEFLWRKSHGRNRAGSAAGTVVRGGAIKITIDKKPYLAHQLAWFYTHGEWAGCYLYHRNGFLGENAIENLTKDWQVAGIRRQKAMARIAQQQSDWSKIGLSSALDEAMIDDGAPSLGQWLTAP